MTRSVLWFGLCLPIFACSTADSNWTTSEEPLPIRVANSSLTKPLRSWKALHEDQVVMQRFDYSCGAAALATILKHYFETDVNEAIVLAGILETLTSDEVADREENGFSLLDLKNFAVKSGYQASGVKLKISTLSKLKGPVLIHMERDGYKHFSVLKGIRGDRIYLADPSRGNIRMSVDRFSHEWSGVALVLGKRDFGIPISHPLSVTDQESVQDELLAAHRALVKPR